MMVRELVKHGLKAWGVELRHYPLFRRAIHVLVRTGVKPTFVQVGANNGIDFDDFFAVVSSYDLPGLVIEPVPYYFEALAQAYKRHRQIVPVQVALHPTDRSATLYRANPDKLKLGWQHGLGSFSREHLIKHGVPADAIMAEHVPCMPLAEVVDTYLPQGTNVDILMTDTEGFDGEILGMVDFRRIRPKIIKFEAKHLPPETLAHIEQRLAEEGYLIERGPEDYVAVEPTLAGRFRYLQASLR